METVKIINKKNGVIKTVKKSLASDYIGTGKFEMYVEKKQTEKPKFKNVQKPTVISNKWFIGRIDKTATSLWGSIFPKASFKSSNWLVKFK